MIVNVTFDEYVAYFEMLARQHVDIQHMTNGKHFTRMNVEDAFLNITNIESPLLALQALEYRTKKITNDQLKRVLKGGFMILRTVELGSSVDEDAALNEMMAIETDIEARMFRDKTGCDYKWLKFLDVGSFQCFKVGPLYNNAFGWLCEFEIDAPLNLVFNPTKWQF